MALTVTQPMTHNPNYDHHPNHDYGWPVTLTVTNNPSSTEWERGGISFPLIKKQLEYGGFTKNVDIVTAYFEISGKQ